MTDTAATHQQTVEEPNRLKTYGREMEVMEIFDGVFSMARSIARTQG
jgi:hypothetical protein